MIDFLSYILAIVISIAIIIIAIVTPIILIVLLIKLIKGKGKKRGNQLETIKEYELTEARQEKIEKLKEINKPSYNESKINLSNCPYERKYLLTKNEYYFYKKLKEITDNHNLQILAKIRLADLIDVKKGLNKYDWNKFFGKIKAKHVDFAIADDMKILLIIELDDSTHNRADRIERDEFVDNALNSCGYKIIHTYGNIEQIANMLNNIKNITA